MLSKVYGPHNNNPKASLQDVIQKRKEQVQWGLEQHDFISSFGGEIPIQLFDE